jgi:hypothetical protein
MLVEYCLRIDLDLSQIKSKASGVVDRERGCLDNPYNEVLSR